MFNLITSLRLILAIAIVMSTQSVFAAGNHYRVTNRPYSGIRQVSKFENKAGMRELSRMERNMFGRSFKNDSQAERVSRLEREMFGMNQPGDVNRRFDNLRAGYRGYRNNIRQCPPQMYTTSHPYTNYNPQYGYQTPIIRSGGGFRGALNSLGNFMLGGTPTGMTPPVNPVFDDWFESDFDDTSSGYSRGFTSNRGYGYHNTRTGGSTGVTILD